MASYFIQLKVGGSITLNQVSETAEENIPSSLPIKKHHIVSVIAITFSIFQIYTGFQGAFDAQIQRAIHLCFGLCLVYLLFPFKKNSSRLHIWDFLMLILAMAPPIYVLFNYQSLVLRAGLPNQTDVIIGVIGVLTLMEAARRVVGIPLVVVATVFLAYAFIGPHMPGAFAHRGVTVPQIINHLYYTTEGIFGIPLGVSSTFIFLFILFGAYLDKTGLGKFFIDISNAIAGWAKGGPAKVAVLSSGLMGTISGSSVANVVSTGSLTIPMMKKLGYKPEFAGAVEAAASTGGQLMPPIMGAAAFLMAEFVRIPYSEVVKAAIVPALLYYIGILIYVHLEASKEGLRSIPRNELPKFVVLFKERGHLILPLIAIIYLLMSGYTAVRAALFAIIISILAACLRKSTRITPKQVIEGLEDGARSALSVVIACATAGIIIGVVTRTGLGLKLGTALLDLANNQLLPALFFTMITSLILGMGVPTTANYVITATIAAPTLVSLGVPVLAAHMFTFYFGIIADITPPVALAAFAASGISQGEPIKTGFYASKLAIGGFIIPYIFVMSPSMLMIDTTPLGILQIAFTAMLGMLGVSSAVAGFFIKRTIIIDRLMFLAGGLLLIYPGIKTDLAGFVLIAVAIAIQWLTSKRQPKQPKTVA